MKPFRFRAQAALDVRRRVEDDARKVFARAEDDARAADARVNDATQSMCVARETLADAQRAGVNGAELGWHQSWITRQRLEVDARHKDAATSAGVLNRALTLVQAAHKERRTLERLRDRMATRHRVETVRHEQREVDQLASLRFAARLISQKGQPK